MTGGFVASLLYSLFIEIHWPPLESRNKAEEVDVKDEGKETRNGNQNLTFAQGEYISYISIPLICRIVSGL